LTTAPARNLVGSFNPFNRINSFCESPKRAANARTVSPLFTVCRPQPLAPRPSLPPTPAVAVGTAAATAERLPGFETINFCPGWIVAPAANRFAFNNCSTVNPCFLAIA
jgi:hypothetical protein